MADSAPDTPPVSPESPHGDTTPPPAHTGETVPTGTPAPGPGENVSRTEFNNFSERITGAITDLTEKIGTLVDSVPRSDEQPVKVPWTHRGKW